MSKSDDLPMCVQVPGDCYRSAGLGGRDTVRQELLQAEHGPHAPAPGPGGRDRHQPPPAAPEGPRPARQAV